MSGMRGVAVGRGRIPDESFEGKLSARGQVVIPQPLREWAELREGTLLTFTPQPDGSILIRRRAPESRRFSKLRGAWQDDAATVRERLKEVRHPSLETLSPEGNE